MNNRNHMTVNKIVITGGVCAGKTSSLSYIKEVYEKLGYHVIILNEVATQLIKNGITPISCGSAINFQRYVLKNQLKQEAQLDNIVSKLNCDKVLIVFDRGAMDSKAYLSDEEFDILLKEFGVSEVELRDQYDAVFHMTSAAKSGVYTTENNSARTESVEEAICLDDRIIRAWVGTPHFRMIQNEDSFADKCRHLIDEISFAVGEPEPYEIERKFLIEYPEASMLINNAFCRKIEICQYYLSLKNEGNIRVRKRGEHGSYIYFKTKKIDVSEIKKIEIESQITEREYNALIHDADAVRGKVFKDRYCFAANNKYFEIDVFPFWKDKALLEIELKDENEEFIIPSCFRIIREVTSEAEYKNSYIAANHK
ncbi:MAG: AAA family ATPase [Clostridium sp.]|nr:AAA family ATPase [Clostridium sp.]